MLYNLKTATVKESKLTFLSMELNGKLQSFFDKQLDGPKIACLP